MSWFNIVPVNVIETAQNTIKDENNKEIIPFYLSAYKQFFPSKVWVYNVVQLSPV